MADQLPDFDRARVAIAAAIEATVGQIGERIVADVRERIDDAYPPSSEPGTPPRRRTGALRDGIASATTADGATTTASVSSSAPYGPYLEFGTERIAPRPFMGPTRDEWVGKVLDVAGELIRENFEI